MIRRLMVLAVLIIGALLLEPLRVPTPDVVAPRSLFLFGLLLLVAETLGTFFRDVGLPRIVGYLAAGVALGPSLFGIVPHAVLTDIGMVKHLAIGIIGLLAGVELKIPEVRARARAILGIVGAQLVVVTGVLTAGILAFRSLVPFLAGLSGTPLLLVALTFGVVLSVNSPMVVLAMLEETRARGPLARTVLGVVLIADVVVILVFTGVFGLARASLGVAMVPGSQALLGLGWELGGSVLAGLMVGGLVALYLRFVKLELAVFVIVTVFTTAAAASALHFELMLALLVAGFVVENVAPVRAAPLGDALRRISWPVFVVFFAITGAELRVQDFLNVWPVVLGAVLLRGAALRVGGMRWARWAGAEPVVAAHAWTGLMSQAGVALGLAAVLGERLPGGLGAAMQAAIVGVIAVNQVIGPILFRRGLVRSGECQEAGLRAEETPTRFALPRTEGASSGS
ncbi:MAG: cation:proton antiporter [Gemmatimonadales bacterium]